MKKSRWFSFRIFIAVTVSIAALYLFWQITEEIVLEQEDHLDHFIFDRLRPIVSPEITKLMSSLTLFGSFFFLVPASILLAVIVALKTRNKKLTWLLSLMVVCSPAILFLLKFIFRRNRPLNPVTGSVDGFSFPSGHSFLSFSFFGLLAYLVWHTRLTKPVRLALCILCILIACVTAFSRAYLRVHFASDVVAGFCLSLAWLCFWWWLGKRIVK